MSIPQARVVKHGGQLFMAPPPPRARRAGPGFKVQMREAAAMALGMWPLFAVMLLMVGLLISAANWNAP